MTRKLIDAEEALAALEARREPPTAGVDTGAIWRGTALYYCVEAIRALPAIEPDYEAAAVKFDEVAVCSGTYPSDWGEQIKARDDATRAIVDAALGPGPSPKPTCETCVDTGVVPAPNATHGDDCDPCPDCAGGER